MTIVGAIIGQIRKHVTKENLHNIWEKIWGKDAPPAEDLFPDDLYAYYNPIYVKLVNKIKLRRFFVSIIILILGIYFLINISDRIKNTPFLACFGKEVCITKGPKINYPHYFIRTIRLDNGDILVLTSGYYNYKYHKLVNKLPRKLFSLLFFVNFNRYDDKYSELYGETTGYTAELYNHKRKKFFKLPSPPTGLNALVKNSADEVLLLSFWDPIYGNFNSKLKKFVEKNDNVFYMKNNPLNTRLTFIKQYDANNALVITNNNHVPDHLINNGYTSEYTLKQPERLYLVNLQNFELKPLPPFALPLKYMPYRYDYRILSNGKIIVPIRACDRDLIGEYCKYTWDHIEIYDPVSNTFTAELNTNLLDQNLFDIDLPNGNVLFINKYSSSIFDNKTNKFTKIDSLDEMKYNIIVNKIKRTVAQHIGVDLNEPIQRTSKIIKIAPDKFLITCDREYYNYPYMQELKSCKRTVYYNFTKNKVITGPDFPYHIHSSSIEHLTDNKLIIIGGSSIFDSGEKYDNKLPNVYTQIISAKK